MKIIEALKEVKRQEEKIGDLQNKVAQYCVHMDFETPTYPDQKSKVSEWLQGVHDSLKEATRLRTAIQKTNLNVNVPIELGGKKVVHSISEWIIRRRLYANQEYQTWTKLTDKNLREGSAKNSQGETVTVKLIRHYDPIERDKKIEEFRSEPGIIDRTLEIINATTDLIE